MIKAVLLDIDNTLLDFNACAEDSIQRGFADRGLCYSPSVFLTFQAVNDGLWQRIESGTLTGEELYRIRWQLIFQRLGIAEDGPLFEKIFFGYLSESCQPVEGALGLLQYLKGRYLVCAASNAPYDQQVRRLSRAGMAPYLQGLFVSEQIGFSKPDREFFDACFTGIQELGRDAAGNTIVPKEILLIGDSLSADMEGGAAYGFQTCWFNYGRRPVPEACPADYIVNTLAEVEKIL